MKLLNGDVAVLILVLAAAIAFLVMARKGAPSMPLFGRTKDVDADLRRHDGLDGGTSTPVDAIRYETVSLLLLFYYYRGVYYYFNDLLRP